MDTYKIVSKLGSGGYGTVYSAIYNNNIIAVKQYVNQHNLSVDLIREIAILFSIRHHYIIPILFVDIDDNINLGMECWGKSLREYMIKTKTKVRVNNSKLLVIQLCSALNYLHTSNIYHRDIKPDNILVKVSNNKLIFKLCDFGLAKQGIGMAPFLGTGNIGTYNYRAIELFGEAAQYDGKSDIWSLGCTLYEFISNRFMFSGSCEYEILQNILDTIPVSQSLLDRYEIDLSCEITEFNFPPLCSPEFIQNNPDDLYLIDIYQRLISNMVCIDNRLTARAILDIYNIPNNKRRIKTKFTIRRDLGDLNNIRDAEVHRVLKYDSDALPLYIELFDTVLNIAYIKYSDYLKNIRLISLACISIASKFIDIYPIEFTESKHTDNSCYVWELKVLQCLNFTIVRRFIKNLSLMKKYNNLIDKTYNNILTNEH